MISYAIRFLFMVVIIIGFGLIGMSSFAASSNQTSLEKTVRDMKKTFTFNAGQRFLMDGVNCHSTTLNKAGFLNYPTHVDLEEFNFIIDSFCKKISSPVAGAVAAVDRKHPMNSHSYYHLTATSVFEKKGLLAKEAYRIRSSKKFDNVDYYQCQVPAETCDDKRVLQLEKRIRLVGIYYANFVSGGVPTKLRDTFQSYLEQNLSALKRTSVTPRCANLKDITLHRGASLSLWAEQIEATFYTQFIPRNAGG